MKVLNFGSLNLDYVYQGESILIPGETQASKSRQIFCGGKGLNQSIALAKAGIPVYHAGLIGEGGEPLLEVCKENGVNTEFIRQIPGPCGHTVIQVDENGQNCILLFGGSNRSMTKEFVDTVLDSFEEGDIILLQNEINMVGEIIRLSHEKGCRVVFNASPIPGKPEELPLELVDIFMVNELEAAALAGTSTEGDFRDILKALQKKYPKAAIVMTLGKEGIPEASQNAVLNANYMMNKLKDLYTMAFDEVCMHEFVMSLEDLKKKAGVSAMDIAKGLLDNGIHPPTMYFPLIVHEALMVEPTETESKEVLDHAIEVFRKLYNDALENPESLLQAPVTTPVTRMDEVEAARHPVLKYEFES